jgi:hypothetical protein
MDAQGQILEKRAVARKEYLQKRLEVKREKYRKYLFATGQADNGHSQKDTALPSPCDEVETKREVVVVIKGLDMT